MAGQLDVANIDVVQTTITVTVDIAEIDVTQDDTPAVVQVSRVDMQVADPANLDVADVWVTQEIMPLPVPIDTYLAIDGEWVAVTRKQLHGGVWV